MRVSDLWRYGRPQVTVHNSISKVLIMISHENALEKCLVHVQSAMLTVSISDFQNPSSGVLYVSGK